MILFRFIYIIHKEMKRLLLGISACMLAACGPKYSEETITSDLRAPAYPLLTLHPHVNIWSAADRLTDRHPTFAEGKELPFNGLLRVDSTLYLFMGSPEVPPMALAPMGGDGEQWEARMTTALGPISRGVACTNSLELI